MEILPTPTPVERAAALRRADGGDFRDELEAHLLSGFVFSTPAAFLMGRPVPKGADIGNVWQTWPAAECDAWYVWLAVGDAWRLMDLTPYPLPWVGWNRQGRGWREIRWLPSALVRRRLHAAAVTERRGSTAIPGGKSGHHDSPIRRSTTNDRYSFA